MTMLAKNMKLLMGRRKISESELSRRTLVGQPVIHRIASGENHNPKLATLRPLAKFFSLTLSQLIGDVPLPDMAMVEMPAPNSKLLHVPLLTLDQAPLWVGHKDQVKTERTLVTDLTISDESFAIQLQDTTMRPNFPEGTVCIIDPHLQPVDLDFVVVRRGGQQAAVFKRYLIDGEDRYLKAMNSDFPAVEMDKDSLIVGTMVEARVDCSSFKS